MMPCFHIPSCDESVFESRRPDPVRSTVFVCSRFFAWAHPIPQKPCFSEDSCYLFNYSCVIDSTDILFAKYCCLITIFKCYSNSHQHKMAITTHFTCAMLCTLTKTKNKKNMYYHVFQMYNVGELWSTMIIPQNTLGLVPWSIVEYHNITIRYHHCTMILPEHVFRKV